MQWEQLALSLSPDKAFNDGYTWLAGLARIPKLDRNNQNLLVDNDAAIRTTILRQYTF